MRCLVVLGLLATMVWADDAKKVYPPYTKPTLLAHRGASAYAPEHTLEAYRLALKQGADFVEPDLQLTKDGVLICLHDTTLERTTNVAQRFPDRAMEVKGKKTWPVSEFTLAEIQTLDAGSWFDAKFAGAKVPTLQEMIDVVKGHAGIIPETKAPETYARLGFSMEKQLLEVLQKNKLDQPGADPKTPVVIQSFSMASLKILREELKCSLPLVFLFSEGTAKEYASAAGINKLKKTVDGIAPNKAAVLAHPTLVKLAHDAGLSVTVWTFRGKPTTPFKTLADEMRHYLKELRVDALFTDHPDLFPRD